LEIILSGHYFTAIMVFTVFMIEAELPFQGPLLFSVILYSRAFSYHFKGGENIVKEGKKGIQFAAQYLLQRNIGKRGTVHLLHSMLIFMFEQNYFNRAASNLNMEKKKIAS
jgi:hypothetical protein